MNSKIINFRELGGIKNSHGQKVKDQLIFRSGNLSFETQELDGMLSPLDIARVYDLRSQGELITSPYRLPEHIIYKHQPILPDIDRDLEKLGLVYPGSKDMADLDVDLDYSLDKLSFLGEFMMKIYRQMGESPQVFGPIIKDMIDVEGAVLYHCSAGKDRTGVLSAMILLGLGVDQNQIMENYLLSNKYREKEVNRELDKLSELVGDERVVDKVRDMLIVKEDFLATTLEAVNTHASFEDYARDKMGLEEKDLMALRDKYLD